MTYHYERNPADPRIAQEFTLEVDDYGNVVKSATVSYPRRPNLTRTHEAEQTQTHITYSHHAFFNYDPSPVQNPSAFQDWYRIGVPIETRTYELKDIPLPDSKPFQPATLCQLVGQTRTVPYEQMQEQGPHKRLIEHQRTTYWKNDLKEPLPLGQVQSLALPYKTYQLAFSSGLLSNVLREQIPQPYRGRPTEDVLKEGGYLKEEDLTQSGLFNSYAGPKEQCPPMNLADNGGNWWVPSGHLIFSNDNGNPSRFYLPTKARDSFNHETQTTYDRWDLLVTQTVDPMNNQVHAVNDYRVLAPTLITDPNNNRSAAAFDALGLVIGTAVMGKRWRNTGRGYVKEFSTRCTPFWKFEGTFRILFPTLRPSYKTRPHGWCMISGNM